MSVDYGSFETEPSLPRPEIPMELVQRFHVIKNAVELVDEVIVDVKEAA